MLRVTKVVAIVCGVILAVVLTVSVEGCKPEENKVPPQAAPPAQQQTVDYEQRRAEMVEILKGQGILESTAVIEAMTATRRHLFIPEDYRHLAYFETPLPIGEGQTISAPGVVAKMTELIQPQPDDIVLEVGTGSGYQAAVLAYIVRHVYTIEILPTLAESAEVRLAELGYDNVTVKCGDGYKGWPAYAPFDGIIVTCAPEEVPQPLKDQLKEGGWMVIPVGPERGLQMLYLLEKQEGAIQQIAVLPVRFVPMTGEAQKQ